MQIHALMLMAGGSRLLGANVNAQSFSQTELFTTWHADLTGANANTCSNVDAWWFDTPGWECKRTECLANRTVHDLSR